MRRLIALVLLIGAAFLITHEFRNRLYPIVYAESINYHAKANGLEPYLVAAVIRVESGYNRMALSPRGAIGLMQLMPETAKWSARRMGIPFLRERLFDPEYNISIGTWYLAEMKSEFGGNILHALAAYNGGGKNVQRWLSEGQWDGDFQSLWQVPFPETRKFIWRVMRDYYIYSRAYYKGFPANKVGNPANVSFFDETEGESILYHE